MIDYANYLKDKQKKPDPISKVERITSTILKAGISAVIIYVLFILVSII